ncbi:MAG: sugar ABC transporter permease [Oscillospiraceae bacterium]|nr:sugar ABC transporter permease [Oscillospiraceae bacterium]
MSKRQKREINAWLRAMLFVAPALTFYIMFSTIPIINTIQISFHEWNGSTQYMEYIGLSNYRDVLSDPTFFKALSHNIYWLLFSVFIPVFLGLILAVMLRQRFVRGRLLFRVTYYMPAVVSLVAVGIVWGWMYNPSFGVINRTLNTVGLSSLTRSWLGDERTALNSLLVAGSWTYYGFCMVIFFAALSGIDEAYKEVALIEGANPIQTFFYVTLPLLRNTVTLLVINTMIGAFRVFDIVYIMTKGGPYRSTEVLSTYMFSTAFDLNQVGKGASISVILLVLVSIFTGVYLHIAEKGDAR